MAAAGGAGLAWWRLQPHAAVSGAEAALWGMRFDAPQPGSPALDMQAFRGRPLLVNFWATWCPPCVEELPMLNTFYRTQQARGWQVVGLAIDQPSSVRQFLARVPVDFPIGLAGLQGTDLGRSLGNLAGGFPSPSCWAQMAPSCTVKWARSLPMTSASGPRWVDFSATHS